eukprot:CAMPEP_0175707194 /NCGR_PEP_ID=MMETSP0097-20121207/38434_1 /TAXON_ID=311494 /ORGANISM="Alexandrium monilatum, Strain CCMP3105" /LENGTH=388 /DNA_ID=CAMNT_0017014561 /DNA_START=1 /DNA_END=1167 /DNA_ORIENTATION=+
MGGTLARSDGGNGRPPGAKSPLAGFALAAGLAALHLQVPEAPSHTLASAAEQALHRRHSDDAGHDGGSASTGERHQDGSEHAPRRVRLRRGKERRLRDLRADMPATVIRQLDQATNYFSNSMRVPAALIAGQAGNMLHRLTELGAAQRASAAAPEEHSASLRTNIYVALWRIHFLLTGYTVCAQLTAVLLCSTAHAQILDIGRDELALEPTALDLIIKHVEFEYVTVRIAFFSGLVTFLLAIATRVAASLGAGPRRSTVTGKRELLLCAAMGAMLVSTLAWWTHIYSEEMTNQGTFYLLRRFWTLLLHRLRGHPLAILSFCAGGVAVSLAVAALLLQGPSCSTRARSRTSSATASDAGNGILVAPSNGHESKSPPSSGVMSPASQGAV